MGVPITEVDVDESHAPFDQSPRQQAIVGETLLIVIVAVQAVSLQCVGRLARDIGQLRSGRLHADGQFIVGNSR